MEIIMEVTQRVVVAMLKLEYLMNNLPDPETAALGDKMMSELLLAEIWESVKDLHAEIREIYKGHPKILLFNMLDDLLPQKKELLQDICRRFEELSECKIKTKE